MKKIAWCFLFVFALTTLCLGQKTILNANPANEGWSSVDYQGKRFRISSVEIDRENNKTYVTIEVVATKKLRELKPPICNPWITEKNRLWESCIKNVERCGGYEDYDHYITDDGRTGHYSGDGNPNYEAIWENVEAGKIHWYTLVFNTVIPHGITDIKIDCNGFCNKGFCKILSCTINNPMPILPNINMTEKEIRSNIEKQHNGIVGIYEDLKKNGLRIACIKQDNDYKIIYLSGGRMKGWNVGEIKGTLSETSIPTLFMADWYDDFKEKETDKVMIGFDKLTMDISIGDSTTSYLQIYPPAKGTTNSDNITLTQWTGTGFSIGNDYIVTNNHVADGAKTISVKGVKGDMNTGYSAEVVATDKVNDIAVLKVTDPNFKGFGTIPYALQQRMADVGEDVFVLGYPLTQALGNEIKLTNGIISSRTGYQGDISTYQMSAPVQPGNSGGPMFDSKGNVIGIVVAGVPGAENVGYAIKTSYLKILIESAGLDIAFPANNTIATLSLAEKVKRVKNYVFYIECSNK